MTYNSVVIDSRVVKPEIIKKRDGSLRPIVWGTGTGVSLGGAEVGVTVNCKQITAYPSFLSTWFVLSSCFFFV